MKAIKFLLKNGSRQLQTGMFIVLLLALFISSGCMMMGAHVAKNVMGRDVNRVRAVNTGQVVDAAIEEVVLDLSGKSLAIKSLAVWQIQSKTAGVDVEVIRRKLISRLISLTKFRIIDRQRLEKLLKEQSLSLSGSIDRRSAVEIGNLIGVEGFINGYVSAENNRFHLSLSLIETETGEIIWAKTTTKEL